MRRVKQSLRLGLVALVLTIMSALGRETAFAKKPPRPTPYYTREECDQKFVTKEAADQKFLTEEEADAKYLTAEQANHVFITREEANATFLTQGAADTRYLNDGQAEVDGDDIKIGTEIMGTNGGGPVLRATNTGQSGHGIMGSGNIGVLGYGHTVNGHYWAGVVGMSEYGPGVQGYSDHSFGGEFWGKGINVKGDIYAEGTKYAVVPMEDGTRRKLTCIESPEIWFEDFGSGQLTNGAAVVEIEPLFLQTVSTQYEYHVFLTPEGDCHGLFVSDKSESSFVVTELQSGSSNIRFSYRIVAKRRGYETERLEIEAELGL